MNVADLLDDACVRIAAALGLDKREARIEARALAAHAWQVDAAWMIAHDTDRPDAARLAAFQSLLRRRLTGEPVAYILGRKEFYGQRFRVTPDVLIPRPETELLVDAALEHIPETGSWRILDLGTGSGAIAISLARHRPLAKVVAVDASAAALAVAETNARHLGATNLRCVSGNWYARLATMTFDTIVANPPYVESGDPHLARGDVRFEPRAALAAGPSGLDDLRAIIVDAPAHLAPDGWLLVEHGWNQGAACRTLFEARQFAEIHTLRDLAGLERVTLGRHPG